MELNWTVIGYFVIGLFAVSGYLKGWWREAVTTAFLGLLVFFLQFPDIAEWVMDRVNDVLRFIWRIIPDFLKDLTIPLGFNLSDPPQIDSSSGQTWLVILLIFIGLAVLLSRRWLSNQLQNSLGYTVYPLTWIGSILGGFLGGLNGFVIINLIREYIIGNNLPDSPTTEIAMNTREAMSISSSGVDVLFSELPGFNLVDNFLGWIFIGLGVLVALLFFRSGDVPTGYAKWKISTDKDKDGNTIYVGEKL